MLLSYCEHDRTHHGSARQDCVLYRIKTNTHIHNLPLRTKTHISSNKTDSGSKYEMEVV